MKESCEGYFRRGLIWNMWEIYCGRSMICRGNGKNMRFIGEVIEVIMLMEDELY